MYRAPEDDTREGYRTKQEQIAGLREPPGPAVGQQAGDGQPEDGRDGSGDGRQLSGEQEGERRKYWPLRPGRGRMRSNRISASLMMPASRAANVSPFVR